MAVPVLTRLAEASGIGQVTGLAIKRVLHLVSALDTNHDSRLDEAGMQYYARGLGLLTAGLPNAGGFLAGLLMGLRL